MKIPYALVAAVDPYTRHTQMLAAIKRGFPRLTQVPIDDAKTMYMACYGPSLQDTWEDLRDKHPLISMSGATRFLADRGIVPDYHCDMDPRPHKWKFIDPPVPGVHYLMASVCHPQTWDILKDQQVTLWHATACHKCTEAFVTVYDQPGALVLNPGSTIGLGALHLGGVLGYRHFEIHGMDGSFKASERHAGMHYGKEQKDDITWDAGGVTYRTSRIMANGVAETINQVRSMPVFCVFHGIGLTQALIREADLPNACCADETEKAAKVRRATATVVTLDTPVEAITTLSDPFRTLLDHPPTAWTDDLTRLAQEADQRRAQARFNTGSLSVDAMLFLRAYVEVTKPRTVAEVGTFIGGSALAMQAGLNQWGGHLYTCDKDNDCLPPEAGRTVYPYTPSTAMLQDLLAKGLKVDLFFFDGRIQPPDLPLILKLSTPRTVYAFDDYTGHEKGVVNVERLHPVLPRHVLTKPAWKDGVTIALLEPR